MGRGQGQAGVSGIGEAWADLARELERELRQGDPHAHVRPWISDSGRLAFEVHVEARYRRAAKTLARKQELRAARICEQCGEPVTRVQAGAVLTVLCTDCVP